MNSLDLAPRAHNFEETLSRPHAVALLYAALVALMAAPTLVFPIPRGNDIVDHWARLTLYNMAPDDPLRPLYRVHFGLIPNLGVDALYLALSPLLSPQSVARLALLLAIALPAAGAFRLHRALFEKVSPTIWFVPFLSYNVATTIGLLNFALGMGLAFFGLAFALTRKQWRPRDVLALNALGVILFFCHLIALAAYALLLGLTLVAPLRDSPGAILRRAGAAMLALAAPAALCLLREQPPATYSIQDTSSVSFAYAPVIMKVGADALAMYLLLGVASLLIWRGLRVAPRAWLALAGFALAAALAPSSWGAASLIDARLKVYVWYFAFAATSLKSVEGLRPVIAMAAVVLTSARLVWVAPAWAEFQRQAADVRRALSVLPQGARALVVQPEACGDRALALAVNLTTFAVIDRRAYVNTLFAQSGVQPVAPADALLDGGPTLAMDPRWLSKNASATLRPGLRNAPWAKAFLDWRRHFTHVIDAHGQCAPSVHEPGLARIGGAAGLDVYRID